MFKKKILVLLSSLMLVSTFGTSVFADENPYREKVLSVNTLYDVGEANLTADDIVQVNGIDCYVLQVDSENNKAELITKGIYDVRFDDTDSYKYHESSLKTWMDNFYTNQLDSDPYILESNVTSYYEDEYDMEETVNRNYTKQTISQHLFALDAVEGQTNASKFSWNRENRYIDNKSREVIGFSVSASFSDYGDSYAFIVCNDSSFSYSIISNIKIGARPAFWLDISGSTKDTNIYYDVTESYEWSVPSKIEFTSTSFENVNATGNDSQVKITKNVIKEGKRLVISLDDENDLKLSETTGHELAYQVFADNSELSIGGKVLSLNAGESCDNAQIDITATLTKDETEIAGEYSDTLVFVVGIEDQVVPTIEGDFTGYYADVDDNGTVDGVIFFDYTQGADTTSGFLGNGVAVASKTEGLASYELKTVDGKDNVVVKTSDGDDRFYVIALEDSKPASGDDKARWYKSAITTIPEYATLTSTAFVSGKSNTATMKAKWDAEAYGAKNNDDMFTIDMGDWFIPSKDEWSVLGSNLKKVATGKYSSMTFESGASLGISGGYWTSSISTAADAWYAYLDGGYMDYCNFSCDGYVRLASTF